MGNIRRINSTVALPRHWVLDEADCDQKYVWIIRDLVVNHPDCRHIKLLMMSGTGLISSVKTLSAYPTYCVNEDVHLQKGSQLPPIYCSTILVASCLQNCVTNLPTWTET
jgi:hypothetical protein